MVIQSCTILYKVDKQLCTVVHGLKGWTQLYNILKQFYMVVKVFFVECLFYKKENSISVKIPYYDSLSALPSQLVPYLTIFKVGH